MVVVVMKGWVGALILLEAGVVICIVVLGVDVVVNLSVVDIN